MSLVSVIIPTYNRAKFLPGAFLSLSSQTYKNFEVIIVDDGSSDNTDTVLSELIDGASFPVRVEKQSNKGPAGARNTGIKLAQGDIIAFFDSDDAWDSNHLMDGIEILEKHVDIDWLYFSARHINMATNQVILPSNFYVNGKAKTLFSCVREKRDDIHVLDNNQAVLAQLTTGLDCAFQDSLIRTRVFADFLIPDFRIGEDRMCVLKALTLDFVLAFVDKTTASYHIHEDNISDANQNTANLEKRFWANESLITSYIKTPQYVSLNKQQTSVLNQRIADEYFWSLGYNLQVKNKFYTQGLKSMMKGISFAPTNIKYYKSFIAACIKGVIRS